MVEATFGEVPKDPAAFVSAFVEAEFLEKWRAGILAEEIAIRFFGKK